MEKTKWERYAAIAICSSVGLLAFWLLFKYALPIFLPFIFAWGLGLLISPVAIRISKTTKIPRGFVGAILMILLLLLIILLAVLAVERLMFEAVRLSESLAQTGGGDIGETINEMIEYISNLSSNLPILRELRNATELDGFWENIDKALASSLTGSAFGVVSGITDFVGRMIASLPTVLITLTVTLISAFYFCTGSAEKQLTEIFPNGIGTNASNVAEKIKCAILGWVRAYLILLTLTFFELFIGLTIIGVRYSFILAMIIAAVDILPVLGTGTVLIPWSIISLLMKNYRVGLGLLILYGVISIVRQISEPKIVGKSLGMPPLLSLISMYVGFRLFGFFGMLAGPAAAMILRAVIPGANKKTESANDETP